MLSYQHAYHAGNLADVHKHAALAVALTYLTAKDKPLSYIETHAGRGYYDLNGHEAEKTGEAAQGIEKLGDSFPADHPYTRARTAISKRFAPNIYPGSPAIAAEILRPTDSLHLAELHPAEHAALTRNLTGKNTHIHRSDGLDLALAITPPTPRRGLMLIDPSYEIKDEYNQIPKVVSQVHKKWNVGVIMLWYPILTDARHTSLLGIENAMYHEVRFPPARLGHGMIGSGLAILNPPFGLTEELPRLTEIFSNL